MPETTTDFRLRLSLDLDSQKPYSIRSVSTWAWQTYRYNWNGWRTSDRFSM